jgi:hypothetical protein
MHLLGSSGSARPHSGISPRRTPLSAHGKTKLVTLSGATLGASVPISSRDDEIGISHRTMQKLLPKTAAWKKVVARRAALTRR